MKNFLFDDNYAKAAQEPSGNFLNIKNFEGEGLIVKMDEKPVRFIPDNPKYGSKKDGLRSRFMLESDEGVVREFSSSSDQLSVALMEAEIDIGDWFRLQVSYESYIVQDKTTGESKEVSYPKFSVIKIDPLDAVKSNKADTNLTTNKVSDPLGGDEMPPDFLK